MTKTVSLTLVLLFAALGMFAQAPAQPVTTTTYTIFDVRPLAVDEFAFSIRSDNPDDHGVRASANKVVLDPFVVELELGGPIALSGHSFQSAIRADGSGMSGFAVSAINALRDASVRLRYRQRYQKEYVPPTFEELDRKTAFALADLKEPDFSEVDPVTLQRAFSADRLFIAVRGVLQVEPNWLNKLSSQVSNFSGGQTRIEPAAKKDQVATYEVVFVLVRGKDKRRLVIGPPPQGVAVVPLK